MRIVRSIRQGRDNDPDFFSRFKPRGVWADLFRSRFRVACQRANIENKQFILETVAFRSPRSDGQLSLL